MTSTQSTSATDLVDLTDPANAIALPILAILAIAVTYLPFKSFWRGRNFPAGNLIAIATLQNLMIIANAIIWRNGDMSTWWHGAVLCDIEVYLRVPSTTAVATSFVAFTRTLSNAIDVDKHNFVDTPARRRRAVVIDVLICWTIPLLQIALTYVIIVSRYGILPVYGCIVIYDASWLATLIMLPWAPLGALYSGIEAAIILWRLRTHRANLAKILSSGNSGYTTRRYVKLLLLALSLIIIVIPLEFFYMWQNIPAKYMSYSWSRVHDPSIWGKPIWFPTSAIPRAQYSGWATVSIGFLVFLFFGFNDDAIDHYRRWLVALGFGRIWPKLKESRHQRVMRRRQSTSRSVHDSSSGWRSHFDLVSKVATKYFEGSRKSSQATTLSGSAHIQSRKNSQGTFSTVALTAVASHTSSPGPTSSSTYRSFFDEPSQHDIEIIQSTSPRGPKVLSQVIEKPSPVAAVSTPVRHGGVLNSWRTQLNLPFLLFKPSSAQVGVADVDAAEPQSSPSNSATSSSGSRSQYASRTSLSNVFFPPPTISTSIWGESLDPATNEAPSSNIKTTTHVRTHVSQPSNASSDDEVFFDPLSPKIGSRAYRERERREMERDKKDQKLQRLHSVAGDTDVSDTDARGAK